MANRDAAIIAEVAKLLFIPLNYYQERADRLAAQIVTLIRRRDREAQAQGDLFGKAAAK